MDLMDSPTSKKLQRKLQKYKNILYKDMALTPSDNVTESLMVCNAGLMNQISREVILAFFVQFGPVKNVVTFSDKSYSFVTFFNQSDAAKCYKMTNGNLKMPGLNGPVYLLFVRYVPEVKNSPDFVLRPPGLLLIEDFVSDSEEETLLEFIGKEPFDKGTIKHRQVKHYGFEFKYNSNSVQKDNPLPHGLPKECDFLWERLSEKGYIPSQKPNQLTVNNYLPGQGIPPHIDTHSSFSDPILSLSLGSDVNMDFKKKGEKHISVLLPRKSLLIMSGESRYAWTHGITPKKIDIVMKNGGLTVQERGTRTSFTFRYVQEGECNCKYPEFCDSQKKLDLKIPEDLAAQLEDVHVHNVYEHISEHFSHTRHTPWPKVLDFVESFPPGSILIDVGCGNGKYFGFNTSIFEVGTDMSSKLAFTSRSRGFEIIRNNCLSLPFVTGIADGLISIAVIHHLATRNRRLQVIKEIVRILRVGGRALIYVWAKNQTNGKMRSIYLSHSKESHSNEPHCSCCDSNISSVFERTPVTLEKLIKKDDKLLLPIHTNRTAFQFQDLLVPWILNKKNIDGDSATYLRYYHVFEENELTDLCNEIPNINIVSQYYDQGNWCVILEKN